MQALLHAIAALPLPGDACRIFHGRGGLYPGCEQWTLDAYPPVFVLTSFAPASEAQLAAIGDALRARWRLIAPPGQALNWVFQPRGDALQAHAEGSAAHQARARAHLMAGQVPDPHIVTEGPARYRVHILNGQNHGLFLDMAEGRRWVRGFAADFLRREGRGAKVLNLFAYTCAFSVAALQGGAAHVTNLDMARSPPANRTTNSTDCTVAPAFWRTTCSTHGASSRVAARTTWSLLTRPATRRAASSPSRTTRACCAAYRACWRLADMPCCV